MTLDLLDTPMDAPSSVAVGRQADGGDDISDQDVTDVDQVLKYMIDIHVALQLAGHGQELLLTGRGIQVETFRKHIKPFDLLGTKQWLVVFDNTVIWQFNP